MKIKGNLMYKDTTKFILNLLEYFRYVFIIDDMNA